MRLVQLYGPDPNRLQPVGIRFGDVIYAANITANSVADALATVCAVLDEAGAGVDGLARATAYVRTPAEREPVYGPWDALFPDPLDRPALKVLLAPVPDGCAVRLDVLALAGGRRERRDIPGVPARDPTVAIGQWVLTSRVHGTDPSTGKVAEGGVDAEARQAVANVAELAESVPITQLTGFVRDADSAAALRRAAPSSHVAPLNILTNFVPPSMNLMLEAIAGAPAVREIFTDADDGPIPDAIMIDDLLFAPAIASPHSGDFKHQLRGALEHLDGTLAAVGLSRSAVAHVGIYFPSVDLKPTLNDVWSEWFPDPAARPPHIYVPDALPAGRLAQLQVFALRGSRREVLHIPGLVHGDPMSMGARIGEHVFSSRIFAGGGGLPDAKAHAEAVLSNVDALLAQAGMSRHDLSQINAFVGSLTDRDAAQATFDDVFGDTPRSARPAVRYLTVELLGSTAVRLEVIGSSTAEHS